MHIGNQYDNFETLSKATLGALVKKLKELDNSDKDPFISNDLVLITALDISYLLMSMID